MTTMLLAHKVHVHTRICNYFGSERQLFREAEGLTVDYDHCTPMK